jgi:hypothetical protein
MSLARGPRLRRRGWTLAVAVAVASTLGASQRAEAQAPADSAAPLANPPAGGSVWRSPTFWAGAGASILTHEAAHVVSAILLGGGVSVGFDKGRPTVYSGLDATEQMDRQFIFSSAGLTVQALLDELVLDRPRAHGTIGTFERGILAGGIGTTIFYFTIGRTGSVSDVDFMARTSSLSKDQLMLIYGTVSALHVVRIAHDDRLLEFFTVPRREGGVNIGVRLK